MDNKYIDGRKTTMQAEFDENAKKINQLQERQVYLQGAFAELTEAAKLLKPKEKKEAK